MKDLEASVAVVAEAWKESDYYADAEQWTFLFWDANHPFRPWFDRLDLRDTLELACGHGRHAERALPLAKRLTLMDIHADNLVACLRRLENAENLRLVLNNGFDFRPVRDASLTAIFCYDAMVHFSPDLVASYLRDAARVLKPGGRALFHHSNFEADPATPYGQNPQARNHMTMELFRTLAEQAGLRVEAQRILDWGGVPDLDGLTLLRKPRRFPWGR